MKKSIVDDLNSVTDFGTYQLHGNTQNSPFGNHGGGVVFVVKVNNESQIAQIAVRSDSGSAAHRVKWDDGWRAWRMIGVDFPEFYKNYADLAALATGMGVERFKLESGESYTLIRDNFIILDYDQGSAIGIYVNIWNGKVDISPFDNNNIVTFSHSGNPCTITNVSGKRVMGLALKMW